MIEVEGYKAFNGVMRITPKTKAVAPKEIKADWLYKPEHKCWYGNGSSYPAEVCIVVSDDTEKQIQKKPKPYNGYERYCCECGNIVKTYQKYCYECGQALDWGVYE